ncbi:MAG: hypothetical protein HPY59_10265 [Anaerolineae bacterium]|nr:hypothetical protein [Anaerolineae bacterium]
MKKNFIFTLLLLFLIATNIPYIFGLISGGDGVIFGGLIQNPIDGNTYLAKMYQGYEGDWKFHLPYSIERGEGAYLFLFYLFLGHLSRWLGFPQVVVFHIARIVSSVALFLSVFLFIERLLPPENSLRRLALVLCLFGSGLGWLAFFFNLFTADIWVAEAFPFLAAYTNPHFPLGLALILFLLVYSYRVDSFRSFLLAAVLGLSLAIVLPFGVVVLAGIFLIENIWRYLSERRVVIWPFLTLIGGGVYLLYQYFAILQDPVLAAWNLQNMTLSPPLWDVILSLSPAFFLAIIGYRKAIRSLPAFSVRMLYGWALFGLLLIYFPFNLQRRFMLGLFIPFSLLAALGLINISKKVGNRARYVYSITVVVSVLTNGLVLSAGFFGILARDAKIYYSQSEREAFNWIVKNTPEDSVILASVEMGLLIPAHTGRRVLYGHPFETIHAEKRVESVKNFFQGTLDQEEINQLVRNNGVDYILWTAREGDTVDLKDRLSFAVVFDNIETRIYDVNLPK